MGVDSNGKTSGLTMEVALGIGWQKIPGHLEPVERKRFEARARALILDHEPRALRSDPPQDEDDLVLERLSRIETKLDNLAQLVRDAPSLMNEYWVVIGEQGMELRLTQEAGCDFSSGELLHFCMLLPVRPPRPVHLLGRVESLVATEGYTSVQVRFEAISPADRDEIARTAFLLQRLERRGNEEASKTS